MYDRVTEILNKTRVQLKRAQADKLVQRIIKELQKRNVKL
jgi:hypothetical protein